MKSNTDSVPPITLMKDQAEAKPSSQPQIRKDTPSFIVIAGQLAYID